jgi:hypothetical protein
MRQCCTSAILRNMKKRSEEDPFPECATCKTLSDCPSPDVRADGFGSPMPHPLCPKFTDIMKATVKERKRLRNVNDN